MNTTNNEGPQPWIDPALEARVVAGVLGETSAFEAAELDRVLAENPELAIFKRRIEAVHALVGAAVRPEAPKIQLSPDRRQKLLEKLGARPAQPTKKVKAFPFRRWLSPHVLNRLVACVVIMAFVAVLFSLSIPAVTGGIQRKASRRSDLMVSAPPASAAAPQAYGYHAGSGGEKNREGIADDARTAGPTAQVMAKLDASVLRQVSEPAAAQQPEKEVDAFNEAVKGIAQQDRVAANQEVAGKAKASLPAGTEEVSDRNGIQYGVPIAATEAPQASTINVFSSGLAKGSGGGGGGWRED